MTNLASYIILLPLIAGVIIIAMLGKNSRTSHPEEFSGSRTLLHDNEYCYYNLYDEYLLAEIDDIAMQAKDELDKLWDTYWR